MDTVRRGVLEGLGMLRSDAARCLHVVCVLEQFGNRVNPVHSASSPRSSIDYMVLQAARAWADATITTGENLRVEESLSADISPDFLKWFNRRETRTTAVMTRGEWPVLERPFLQEAARLGHRLLFFSGSSSQLGADLYRKRDKFTNAKVVGLTGCGGLQETLEYLVLVEGLRSITVEAGPSTVLSKSTGLYNLREGSPLRGKMRRAILLTTFHGPVDVTSIPLIDPPLVVGDVFNDTLNFSTIFEARWTNKYGPWSVRLLDEI